MALSGKGSKCLRLRLYVPLGVSTTYDRGEDSLNTVPFVLLPVMYTFLPGL